MFTSTDYSMTPRDMRALFSLCFPPNRFRPSVSFSLFFSFVASPALDIAIDTSEATDDA